MLDMKEPDVLEGIDTKSIECFGEDFNHILPIVVANEGVVGSYGVSQTDYNRHRKNAGKQIVDVCLIEPEELARILYYDKWIKSRCHELPQHQYVMFDSAVNSGVANAIKQLQRAIVKTGIHVEVTGVFDPSTMEIAKKSGTGLTDFVRKERWAYYLGVPKLKNILGKLKVRVWL